MDREKSMKSELTKEEQFLLREIAEFRRYPVVCFELRSSREAALRSTALRNVHMETGRETMEEVKSTAALLEQLEKKGCIRLEYDLFVTVAADYACYRSSSLYAMLLELVKEGRNREGFLFDKAAVNRGIAQVTSKGRTILKEILA